MATLLMLLLENEFFSYFRHLCNIFALELRGLIVFMCLLQPKKVLRNSYFQGVDLEFFFLHAKVPPKFKELSKTRGKRLPFLTEKTLRSSSEGGLLRIFL